jgi:hypothetical protein
MPVTLVTTVAGATSNSYATQAEADAYFNARLPLEPPWEDADDPTAALATATRVLDSFVQPLRILVRGDGGDFYITRRQWTGAPATTTQRLAWPRTGMYDKNGNAIPSNVIPEDLKFAQSELAGLLLISDTTLDNAVRVGGIKSVSAGSVSVSFKDMIEQHVLPEFVWFLMPASWFTDEILTPARPALFDVVS